MRRYIRNSAVLYPIYIKWVVRNKSAIFPDADTQLHLTGFQRSANTYCYNIIRSALPSLRLSTHIHTIGSLKLAKRHGVPTILLLRDPFATCGSYMLKCGISVSDIILHDVLSDYYEYHDYAWNHKDHLNIISFSNAISGPEYILRYVVKFLNLPITDEGIQQGASVGQKLVEKKEALKDPEGSSLPTKERTRKKEVLRERFEQIPLYREAQQIYEKLHAHETLIGDL
jgi:hypothetical protein